LRGQLGFEDDRKVHEPQPGRPQSLGAEIDHADARAVLDIVMACRAALRPERSRAGAVRVLRETLWFLWEAPRLPGELVASKYPKSYPWSPLARARFAERAGKPRVGGWGLVIEHLYPRELLVGYFLDYAGGDDTAKAVEVLTTRLMAAVVTREEDRLLPTRRQSDHPWEEYASDPWMRYRAVGISIKEFTSLASPLGGAAADPPQRR
jgi:hypothetical protein